MVNLTEIYLNLSILIMYILLHDYTEETAYNTSYISTRKIIKITIMVKYYRNIDKEMFLYHLS